MFYTYPDCTEWFPGVWVIVGCSLDCMSMSQIFVSHVYAISGGWLKMQKMFRTRNVERWYRTLRISLTSTAVTQLGCNICCRGISLTKCRAFFNYALRVVSIDEEVSHFIGLFHEICII